MTFKLMKEVQHFNHQIRPKSWKTFLKVFRELSESTVSANAKSLFHLLRDGKILDAYALADSMSEQKYSDATQHFVENQFAALVKKYPFPARLNPFNPTEKAKENFFLAEQNCKAINERFLRGDMRFLENKLHRMRSFIRYTIGERPSLSEIYSKCDFGPGANILVSGNATHIASKIDASWSCTPSAFYYARSAIKTNAQLFEYVSTNHEGHYCFDGEDFDRNFQSKISELVNYNKIAFVPKTSKTDRSIAVEPLLNSFIQKGTDLVLRDRLRRIRIDLSDQGINSQFAQFGSESDSDNDFVTIDLKSASDSISIELCRNVIPAEWFEFLDSIRSKNFKLDDKVKPYHKFCSMGNGFCFPLETLLFASAIHACNGGLPHIDFVVYGDDIIVRKHCAAELISFLKDIGFATNTEKTFLEGPFRESCGRDWYGGKDVRPFVLDFELNSLSSLIKFLNLSRRSDVTSTFFECIRPLIIDLIPQKLRFMRPLPGNPESAITVDFDLFLSSPHGIYDRNMQCWSWLELLNEPLLDKRWRSFRRSEIILTYAALRGNQSTKPFTLRRLSHTRVRRVAHSQYNNTLY